MLVIPPLAITGTDNSRASSTVALMFTPVIMPSRPMSVWMTRLDAVILKFLGQVDHVVAGYLRPTVHRNLAVSRIESDHDVTGKGVTGVVQKSRVFTAAVPMMM